MWLSKLGDYDAQTFEEADLRNEILHRLMHGCKTWQISEPFHIEPADIIDLKQIFVTKIEYCGKLCALISFLYS